MIAGGQVVSGNDGGVYTRALSNTQQYGGWTDTNNTLHDLQYYDARAGFQPRVGTLVYGGLQDNGSSVLTLGAAQNKSPAGGDGTTVIVDPDHANKWVGSYVDGAMYSSTDGGHSFYDYVSPGCVGQATVGMTPRADCDPNIRFVTPMTQDPAQRQRLARRRAVRVGVQGGLEARAARTRPAHGRTCSTPARATPSRRSARRGTPGRSMRPGSAAGATPVRRSAAGSPPITAAPGISSTWPGCPNRYIAGVTVDPENPAHAYAVFNGYSRRWIPAGGVGHVYETFNGGQSWNDISGNLPDVPGDALLIKHGQLALATDLGMYTARTGQGAQTNWYRLGLGLPNASVNDVTPGPDGYIYAGTHGRGIWRIPFGHGHGEH